MLFGFSHELLRLTAQAASLSNLLSGNFGPLDLPSVGASGSICGTAGAVLVDLTLHRRPVTQQPWELPVLCACMLLDFIIGLFSSIDSGYSGYAPAARKPH